MPMLFGYARVSTQDQTLDLQIDALRNSGCERIFEEKISGKASNRPALNELLSHLRTGDTVVVWKLDRLARSLKDLIDLINLMKTKGVNFLSLKDNINTETASGRLTFNIFASLAEFETDIIRERTKAGLQAAQERGRKGGRPKGLTPANEKKMKAVKKMRLANVSIGDMKKILKISSNGTIYKYINYKDTNLKTEDF